MIKILGQEDEESDFYEFALNDEQKPEYYSEGLWTDGKILQLNPDYMENNDWSALKRSLTGNSLRAILGFFRQMGCYDIPRIDEIARDAESGGEDE